jgi:hypothetical protein
MNWVEHSRHIYKDCGAHSARKPGSTVEVNVEIGDKSCKNNYDDIEGQHLFVVEEIRGEGKYLGKRNLVPFSVVDCNRSSRRYQVH